LGVFHLLNALSFPPKLTGAFLNLLTGLPFPFKPGSLGPFGPFFFPFYFPLLSPANHTPVGGSPQPGRYGRVTSPPKPWGLTFGVPVNFPFGHGALTFPGRTLPHLLRSPHNKLSEQETPPFTLTFPYLFTWGHGFPGDGFRDFTHPIFFYNGRLYLFTPGLGNHFSPTFWGTPHTLSGGVPPILGQPGVLPHRVRGKPLGAFTFFFYFTGPFGGALILGGVSTPCCGSSLF